MNMHVPSKDGQTQLAWLFLMINREVQALRSAAEALPAGDDRVRFQGLFGNLAIAIETAEIAAGNFEGAVLGVMGVVAHDDAIHWQAADALLAPLREELGDMYVDFEMARAARLVG